MYNNYTYLKNFTFLRLNFTCQVSTLNLGDPNENITAVVPNSAVSRQLLKEIQSWKNEGASTDDVITRLRMRTGPPGYVGTIHNWCDGMYIRVV